MDNISCNLIVIVVNKGFSEMVMDIARDKGATGGTILCGRGTSNEKAKKFFALSIQEEKEVVLILSKTECKADIMKSVGSDVGISTPGQGIIFSLPVEDILGVDFVSFEERKKDC